VAEPHTAAGAWVGRRRAPRLDSTARLCLRAPQAYFLFHNTLIAVNAAEGALRFKSLESSRFGPHEFYTASAAKPMNPARATEITFADSPQQRPMTCMQVRPCAVWLLMALMAAHPARTATTRRQTTASVRAPRG
jgi:hypothetical protein